MAAPWRITVRPAAKMPSYFDVNEGDELMAETMGSEGQPLSWRQDAETTHSDWTIIVNDGEPYHVHKAMLSVGPRSCMYFSTLFSTPAGISEKQDNTSRINLDERDAAVFPAMLDFVYSPIGKLEATTDNVVALRSLACYFRCRELMKKANMFIQKTLTDKTAVNYLRSASERNDEKVMESARKLIVEQYPAISLLDVVTLPRPLVKSIVCSKDMKVTSLMRVGNTVTRFFEKNPEELNAPLLNEMTSRLSASTISFDAAKRLRNLVGKLDPQKEDKDSLLTLDKLCKACAEKLAPGWKQLDVDKCIRDFEEPIHDEDFRGSGRLSVSRLGGALKQAKKDSEQQLQSMKNLQAQLRQKQRELNEAQAVITSHSATISSQQARISQLESKIDQEAKRKKPKTNVYGLPIL